MNQDFWLLHYEYKDYPPLTTVTHTGKMVPSEESIPARYKRRGKTLIVKDIVDLLSKISLEKNNAEKAVLCYKLANAWFNTSYNGKAWSVRTQPARNIFKSSRIKIEIRKPVFYFMRI